MDFDLNEDERSIQDSARRFAEKHALTDSGSQSHEKQGAADRGYWDALTSQGFLALGIPSEYGGFGGAAELAVVCREFGRGPLPGLYLVSSVFAAQTIVAAGAADQKSQLLPALVSGESPITVAYREPGDFKVLPQPRTRAMKRGSDFILTGRKELVIGGAEADLIIVTAVVDDADGQSDYTLFLVDPKDRGVSCIDYPLVDGTRAATIQLDSVRVSASDVLGTVGGGSGALPRALQFAILGVCSETAGAVSQALKLTIDHVRSRKQFGVRLADFQIVRSKIATMAIDSEAAWGAICALISSLQEPAQRDPYKTSSMAKVLVDGIGQRVCSEAIQLHGGMGMTDECAVGRYFKRTTAIRALYGSAFSRVSDYAELLALERNSVLLAVDTAP